MALNSLKKTIVFSNEDVKKFIELRTGTIAKINKTSTSGVIEDILLDRLLPKQSLVNNMVQGVYRANWRTEDVLEAVFSWNTEWVNFEARFSNFLPLVEFIQKEQIYNNSLAIRNNERMYHFLDKLDSVARIMNDLNNSAENDMEKMYWEEEERYVRDLIDQTDPKDTKLRPINFYKIFTKPKNWEIFKGKQMTYIVMLDLIVLQRDWRNDPETKEIMLQTLENISSEWSADEKK